MASKIDENALDQVIITALRSKKKNIEEIERILDLCREIRGPIVVDKMLEGELYAQDILKPEHYAELLESRELSKELSKKISLEKTEDIIKKFENYCNENAEDHYSLVLEADTGSISAKFVNGFTDHKLIGMFGTLLIRNYPTEREMAIPAKLPKYFFSGNENGFHVLRAENKELRTIAKYDRNEDKIYVNNQGEGVL